MNTYYGHEEDVETPETQLANFRAQEGAVDAVAIWARETQIGIYDKTLELWNAADAMRTEAEQRGDQAAVEQLTETQNGLTEIYKGAEHMQQNLLHTNAAMKSVLEAAEALARQKKEIESELEDLTEAIGNAEPDHPLVRDLIEMVEQNAYEYASDGLYDDAWESASESIYSEFYTTLRKLAPTVSYFTMERFVSALKGDDELNDIQRGLVLSLLQTFMTEIKAS